MANLFFILKKFVNLYNKLLSLIYILINYFLSHRKWFAVFDRLLNDLIAYCINLVYLIYASYWFIIFTFFKFFLIIIYIMYKYIYINLLNYIVVIKFYKILLQKFLYLLFIFIYKDLSFFLKILKLKNYILIKKSYYINVNSSFNKIYVLYYLSLITKKFILFKNLVLYSLINLNLFLQFIKFIFIVNFLFYNFYIHVFRLCYEYKKIVVNFVNYLYFKLSILFFIIFYSKLTNFIISIINVLYFLEQKILLFVDVTNYIISLAFLKILNVIYNFNSSYLLIRASNFFANSILNICKKDWYFTLKNENVYIFYKTFLSFPKLSIFEAFGVFNSVIVINLKFIKFKKILKYFLSLLDLDDKYFLFFENSIFKCKVFFFKKKIKYLKIFNPLFKILFWSYLQMRFNPLVHFKNLFWTIEHYFWYGMYGFLYPWDSWWFWYIGVNGAKKEVIAVFMYRYEQLERIFIKFYKLYLKYFTWEFYNYSIRRTKYLFFASQYFINNNTIIYRLIVNIKSIIHYFIITEKLYKKFFFALNIFLFLKIVKDLFVFFFIFLLKFDIFIYLQIFYFIINYNKFRFIKYKFTTKKFWKVNKFRNQNRIWWRYYHFYDRLFLYVDNFFGRKLRTIKKRGRKYRVARRTRAKVLKRQRRLWTWRLIKLVYWSYLEYYFWNSSIEAINFGLFLDTVRIIF